MLGSLRSPDYAERFIQPGGDFFQLDLASGPPL